MHYSSIGLIEIFKFFFLYEIKLAQTKTINTTLDLYLINGIIGIIGVVVIVVGIGIRIEVVIEIGLNPINL